MLKLQPWDLLFVDRGAKHRTKCILSVFSPEDIISRWVAVAVNSSQLPPPPPALSGGKSTDFLCLNGLAKDNFYIWEREGRKSTSSFFFCRCFVLDLYDHFKMAPVLLCFVHEGWFESYVGLNEKKTSFFGLLVRNQRLLSLFSVHVGNRHSKCFHRYFFFSSRNFCDHVRYSSFVVFKPKVTINPPTPLWSCLSVCMLWEYACKCTYFFLCKCF